MKKIQESHSKNRMRNTAGHNNLYNKHEGSPSPTRGTTGFIPSLNDPRSDVKKIDSHIFDESKISF